MNKKLNAYITGLRVYGPEPGKIDVCKICVDIECHGLLKISVDVNTLGTKTDAAQLAEYVADEALVYSNDYLDWLENIINKLKSDGDNHADS